MCFKKQSTEACLRVYVLNVIVAWEHTVSMCVCIYQVCCTICKKNAFGSHCSWRDSTAPSDWWADFTFVPQHLFREFQMERLFFYMVAIVSMGRAAEELQSGFQEWVRVCISPFPICAHSSALSPLAHSPSPPPPFSCWYYPFLMKYQHCLFAPFSLHTEHNMRLSLCCVSACAVVTSVSYRRICN